MPSHTIRSRFSWIATYVTYATYVTCVTCVMCVTCVTYVTYVTYATPQVDCNVHRVFCETRQQIDRFPTIRAYANGGTDMEIYKHNLDTDSIVAYVQSLMHTRAQHLQAAHTLE